MKRTFLKCKLNKNYQDALKWTPSKKEIKKISAKTICDYYGIPNLRYPSCSEIVRPPKEQELWWRQAYAKVIFEASLEWNDDDDGYNERGTLACCGLSELITGDTIGKDTPENRHQLAKKIKNITCNDSRIFITGLPVRKVGGGSSAYYFKNYLVIEKILLDFGMQSIGKQYTNANSNNRLSVLVGQFP